MRESYLRYRETEMRMLRQINVNTREDIIQNEKMKVEESLEMIWHV